MNRPDVCDLITMVYAKDREGYETETEVVNTVFCNWQEGVSQNEFYLAHKEGFQATASVDIFSADYEDNAATKITVVDPAMFVLNVVQDITVDSDKDLTQAHYIIGGYARAEGCLRKTAAAAYIG